MKTHLKKSTIRGFFTLGTALLIWAGSFFDFQDFAAVCSGCIFGGIYGSGAAGIFFIYTAVKAFILTEGSQNLALFSGVFLGSLAAGLILGSPMTFEKKLTARYIVKVLAAVLAGYILTGLFIFIYADWQSLSLKLPSLILKIFASIFLTLTLRPIAARFLYGSNEEEAEELLQSIQGNKNDSKK